MFCEDAHLLRAGLSVHLKAARHCAHLVRVGHKTCWHVACLLITQLTRFLLCWTTLAGPVTHGRNRRAECMKPIPPSRQPAATGCFNTVRRTSNPNRGVRVDEVLNCWTLAKESPRGGVPTKAVKCKPWSAITELVGDLGNLVRVAAHLQGVDKLLVNCLSLGA